MDRVLMVDDDTELCEITAEYLAPEGFGVESVHDGAEGVEKALTGDYALVLLDVMLPKLNGFEVLRRIRSGTATTPAAISQVPVLMLTARGDAVDRIVGLEVGADDYLPKPFNERELVARMRAILRRMRSSEGMAPVAGESEIGNTRPTAPRLKISDVEAEPGARNARRGDERLDLTAVEFDLLVLLLREAGKVVTRDAIAREVLDRQLLPLDRAVDTHVSHLRRKLGPALDGGERIKTVRGVGYIYALESELMNEFR